MGGMSQLQQQFVSRFANAKGPNSFTSSQTPPLPQQYTQPQYGYQPVAQNYGNFFQSAPVMGPTDPSQIRASAEAPVLSPQAPMPVSQPSYTPRASGKLSTSRFGYASGGPVGGGLPEKTRLLAEETVKAGAGKRNFHDPKAIKKAIMTAKMVANMIDPHFGRVPLPGMDGMGEQKPVEEHSAMIHEAYGQPMPEHFARGGLPTLKPAIRHKGKVYSSVVDHLSALSGIEDDDERRNARMDAENRGYVNERGHFLDRYRAQGYAKDHGLIRPDAPEWAHSSPELISENLMRYPDQEERNERLLSGSNYAAGGDVGDNPHGIPVVGEDLWGRETRLAPVDMDNPNGLMKAYRHKIEYVPVHWLKKMRGNELRHSDDEIWDMSQEIRRHGLRNPVIISAGKNSRTAKVGEGNHRVEAADLEGYTHIPAFVSVGDTGGDDIFPKGYHHEDLIPEPNRYFSAESRPSSVFRSLSGGDKYASGGEVDDQDPYSQPNDMGLYSHAAATAAGLPQERGTPEQFRGMLLNKGVKPAELQWSGYDEAFANEPSVTRSQLAEHFHKSMPTVRQAIFANEPPHHITDPIRKRHRQEEDELRRTFHTLHPDDAEDQLNVLKRRHRREMAEATEDYRDQEPYHEDYTIPGGENYREILLKHGDDGRYAGVPQHFGGEPDVLASLMVKDRKDTEGKKILHIDELQSDWAQKGRQHGFKGSESQEANKALDDYLKSLQERTGRDVTAMWPDAASKAAREAGESFKFGELMLAANEEKNRNKGMPGKAPYVGKTEDWVDLGLKRALHDAAVQGHDKLAWSPGQTISDRYDLSKHVGAIRHEKNDDGTYNLDIADLNGVRVDDFDDMSPEEVVKYLGKEMANKVFEGHGEADEDPGYRDWRTISGPDLKIGQQWPFEMYDRMIPKRLLKLAKQHDPEAKIGVSEIQHESPTGFGFGSTRLHALEITPRMRESILKKGFAAYADGGEVEGYADGGDIDPDIFREHLKRIHSPLSEDPESVRKALQIAGSYRAPTGMETGVGSLYSIKQSMPASAVTRTIQDIPGVKLKPKKQGKWEDFYDLAKGNEFVNVGGDLSGFGRLTHINGKELAWPVDLHAGADYMREPNPGRVWANIGAHATGFQTKIREANERGKELYGVLSPMGPSAVNSSHNMFDTLMAQIPNAEIDPEHLKEFDEAIKRGDHLPPKIKRNAKLFSSYLEKLKKWPGLEDAKEVSEFARPWRGNLTGAHRSDIVKFMDKSYWRDRGFPEVGVTRAAITNPDLMGAGGNKLGYRVVKLSSSQPKGGKSIFKHSTYPVDTFGEYVMDVPLVQRHYAQPDVIERLIQSPTKAGQIVHPYSEDPMGRSTARKMFEEQKQIQPVNQRFIDSVMMGMENQKKYGFKEGGTVRKALMIAKGVKKK